MAADRVTFPAAFYCTQPDITAMGMRLLPAKRARARALPDNSMRGRDLGVARPRVWKMLAMP